MSALPRASVNSALVGGSGMPMLNGPDASGCSMRNVTARSQSGRAPWPCTAARAQSGAGPSLNSGSSGASSPPWRSSGSVVRSKQTRAPASRPVRRRLPPLHELGQEAGARLTRLGEYLVTAVGSVQSHRRAGQQRRLALRRGHGAGQRGGGIDPRGEELSADAPGARPASDRGAGQVDDGVGPIDDDLVEATGARVPEGGVRQRVVRADEPGDLMVVLAQVGGECRAQEARGAADDDMHPGDQDPSSASKDPFWSRSLTAVRKRPASAPSMMRWS